MTMELHMQKDFFFAGVYTNEAVFSRENIFLSSFLLPDGLGAEFLLRLRESLLPAWARIRIYRETWK